MATLNPTQDFHPGELVQVTATTGVESTSGQSLDEPYVWQFRAAVSREGLFSRPDGDRSRQRRLGRFHP